MISESSSEEEQVKISYADSDDNYSDFEPIINWSLQKSSESRFPAWLGGMRHL